MADNLPDSFPSMGAEFIKPYMEFEYQGQVYKLNGLQGGHNGRVAAACKANKPEYDPEKGRWIVKVQNNLIDIDLSQHPSLMEVFPENKQILSQARIFNNPRKSYTSVGFLITNTTSPDEKPTFPIDCVFNMFIRITLPGKPSLINVKPFQLVAKNLDQWPPPVGTVYEHEDIIELYPEWMPFAEHLMQPIVRIPPGDQTILTNVFEKDDTNTAKPNILKSIINRFT